MQKLISKPNGLAEGRRIVKGKSVLPCCLLNDINELTIEKSMHSWWEHAFFNDINELTKEKTENILSKTQNACCHDMHILFLFIKSLISLIKHQHQADRKSLTFINFRQVRLLLKVMFGNFFKMLNSRIRRSMSLLLPSYVMKRKNPVSASLFILKGVKPAVSSTRNKMFKLLNLSVNVVVPPLLHYLYRWLSNVWQCFHRYIYRLEVSVDTAQSCGECFIKLGSIQVCYNLVTVKLHTPRLVQACFI